MKKKNFLLALLILANLFVPLLAHAEEAQKNSKFETAVVYYNEACSMCAMYIREELIPTLEEAGIKNIVKKDYVNERKNRVVLNELHKRYKVPPTLQGHFVVFVEDRIVLGGHVPKHIIMDLLTKNLEFDRVLVLQDEMEDAKSYFAWGFKGEAKEYAIDTPIKTYLKWFEENKKGLKSPEISYQSSWGISTMLPLIISTGFLDGINPCAFAVLLLFIAFLYTIRRSQAGIWKMGLAYISSIFLAYFLIGIGLIKAFIFTGYPHLMAEISAYVMIGLGIINISNYLLPSRKLNLGIPSFAKKYLLQWMHKATIPAALVLGFLVGLCTFPCSGGMYVAIVGLLAAKTTMMQGLFYLIIYNLAFVLPLVIILVASSNKKATEKITQWEQSQSKILKLILGIIMIALGLAILFWFI